MRRSLLALIVLVGLALSASVARTEQIATESGLAYLRTVQLPNGAWAAGMEAETQTTATATRSFQLLGASDPAVTSAIAFLSAQSFESLEDRAIQTEALVASLTDVSSAVAAIKALQQVEGGWGADVSNVFPNEVIDTIAALRALTAAGAADTATVARALGYLLDAQNTDGGWGAARGWDSEVFYTAQAVIVLTEFRSTFQLSTSLQSATVFLVAQQHPDGRFGEPTGTTFETALALQALVQSIVDQVPSQRAVTALLTTQAANGSWGDDAYSTALAIRALADIKPNLLVGAATLSAIPPTPQDGQPVTLSIPVSNTGLQDAANVVVRFFLSDPNAGGVQIGTDQIIASIPAGNSAPASITHSFIGTGGRTIFVQVDPANAIAETSETDNLASSRLWVATPPDLAVFTADLVPSSFTPEPGTAFALEYTVRNLGEGSTGPLTMAVYDGNPSAGGVLLGTQDLSGVSGAGSRTSTVGITLTSAVAHTVYVVADSTNQVTEQSETNNQASVTVQVGATPMAVDLAVTPMDVTLTPARPQSGEIVQVTVRFRNEGTEPATGILVELFDGAPESGGTLLGSDTRALAAGEEQTLTATWTATVGIHDLYVVLDRTNQIVEIKETNNLAVVRVMPDLVDLAVSATDLAFTPPRPVIGDAVVLTVTVRNVGIRETGPFTVALYDGDPSAGGVLLRTYPVSTLAGDTAGTFTDAFTGEGRTYRFHAVADVDGQVVELDETNNQAMRSLRIKAPGEILGPDLVPIKLDVTGATTDSQTLQIGGAVRVTVQNRGDAKITTPFSVLIFDDTDFDGRYTAGVDTALGSADNATALWPEGANLLTVPLAGTVRFLHAPLHALVDADDAVAETGETNNSLRSGADCEVRPAQPIQPVLKWTYGSPLFAPPAVTSLTDDNGDGRVDHDDAPDLVVITWNMPAYNPVNPGRMWAIRGDNGLPIWSVADSAHPIAPPTFVAVGDLDQDGLPEIVVPRLSGGLLAFEHDGTLKWDNQTLVTDWNRTHPVGAGGFSLNAASVPTLTDLDADGVPEIVIGATVFNADGSVRWSASAGPPFPGVGTWSNGIRSSIAVDLDLDGRPEIVGGNAAYNGDGTLRWWNDALTDGLNAVANLDDDAYPELVLITNINTYPHPPGSPRLYLLEHDGTVTWGPVYLNQVEGVDGRFFSAPGSPPVIADVDGDGRPEIGVNGVNSHLMFDRNGHLKQAFAMPYNRGYGDVIASPTVFDLDGDGRAEVVANTNGYVRVFAGRTGARLFEDRFGSGGVHYQSVHVADVDADHRADIMAYGDGLRVYGSATHDWADARRIWNQSTYHVTNIHDDGTIPRYEAPSWLVHNSYRVQAPVGETTNPYLAANLTASYLRAVQTGAGTALTVRVGNGGVVSATSGAPVAWYDGDPAAGGVLIGSGQTTRALAPGDYQDLVFTWTGASAGSHTLVAVVDPDAARIDCDPTDNRASLTATIVPILPDLAVANNDVQATGPLTEGRLIPVRVTVHNVGGADAASAAVRLTLGDPTQGGVELGRATLPALAAGASAAVDFTWDSLGATGTNYLYAQVDPEGAISEASAANNTALTVVDLPAPGQPDLAVSQVAVSPSTIPEGQSLTITAQVLNRGADVGGAELALYLGEPSAGGINLGTRTIATILPHGQTATVSWTVDTLGRAGGHTVVALADPNAAIPEIDETNNRGTVSVTIVPSGLSATVGTSQASYTANEAVPITVTLYNSGQACTVDVDVLIEDASGALVATVANLVGLTLAEGETRPITGLTFNTGTTFAGDYRVRGRVHETGTPQAEGLAAFVIRPIVAAEAGLVADKQAYSSHETVTLTTTVTSRSPNHVLTGVTATITVTDLSSTVLFAETRSLPDLLPGARIELKSFWDTGTELAGLYTASVTVQGAGGLFATAQTAFEILSSAVQAAALGGELAINPATIVERESTTLTYTIQNIGNTIDLPLIQVEVLVVDPDTETPVRTITAETALNGREIFTQAIPFDSTGLAPKPYLVVLRGTTAGVTQALASGGLTITPLPNEAPIANAGPDRLGFVGQSVTMDGSASSDPDGDPLAFAWSFVSIPTDSQVTDAALINATTTAPSFIPDADGTYVVSLTVHDGLETSQVDTAAVHVSPAPAVDLHPETVNLKSAGGSRSLTIVLASPVLSAFEWLTAEDGVTVTATFALENQSVDGSGQPLLFTIPAEPITLPGRVVGVDGDGNGTVDRYELVLKADRQALIAGFTDAAGRLRITQPTALITTVIGNDLRVGHDINTVIAPAER